MTKATNAVADGGMMLRLWMHEALRVFYDRLVNDEDRALLCTAMSDMLEKHFKEKMGKLINQDTSTPAAMLQSVRGLFFGDYMVPGILLQLYNI